MARISDISSGAFYKFLGMKPVVREDRKVELYLEIKPELLQYFGKVHGGVTATMIDVVVAAAINLDLPETHAAATVELKCNYLRPVAEGELVARATVVHHGKTLAVGYAEVWDDKGRKIAFGTGTYHIYEYRPPQV